MAITAKFEADFNQFVGEIKKAEEHLKALTSGAANVEVALKSVNTAGSNWSSWLGKAGGVLSSAFGQFTAANLATSAIHSMTAAIEQFVDIGVKLPAVEASFGRMTGAINADADAMLANMTDATLGMVSNYDLMLSANKAMLLGLPVTAESMGELAKTATILGRAMGQDATQSLDDLVTALGRSSPLILDNLGLTVKVGEANEAYAEKLGKSAAALTDTEKKMAFYVAAMEAARKKTLELGDTTKTLSEIAATAFTKVGNVIALGAKEVNVGMGSILTSGKEFSVFLGDVTKMGFTLALASAAARADIQNMGASMTELVGPLEAGANKAKDMAQWLNGLKASTEGLTAQQKVWIDQSLALGVSEADIAAKIGVSELAVKSYITTSKQRATDAKAALEDEQKAQQTYADIEDTLHGVALKHQKEQQDAIKRTLEIRNKETIDGLVQIQQAEAALNDFIEKDSLDAASYQILQIWKAADAKVAAFDQTSNQLAAYTSKVMDLAWREANAVSEAAYSVLDKVTEKAVGAARAVQLAIQQIEAHQAVDVVANSQAAGVSGVGMQAPIYVTPPIFARAAGGPVSSGQSYMVGERGPELFVPSGNGSIMPNGSGATVTNHIYVNGTAEEAGRKIAKMVLRTILDGQKMSA